MKGTQRRMVCPACSKVFFAWRPDDLPGAKVKCYFCATTFEDEAAQRKPIAPAAPPPPAAESSPAAPAAASGEPAAN